MHVMKLHLLAATMLLIALTSAAHAQTPAPATPETLVAAAKRAAGTDYAGTFLRICVAPDNLGAVAGGAARGAAPAARGAAPPARTVPDRATWYARPYKVFDNLYFVGTKIHSSWALTTSDGIIVIDTLFDYAIEPEIVEGLTTLGLNPQNPSMTRTAFDESLRWDSPSRMAGRITTRDVEVEGYVIPAGTRCGLLFAAANRDPRKWSDPDRFDIGRDVRGQVGWGAGVHMCVGRTLAQLEADAMFGAMLQKIQRFEAAGEPEPWMTTIGHGPSRLPVRVVRN
jgi:hypothetical protein